ncbi:MAG: Nickel responsive regulator NikR [Myxococcales bacterium]|nr:Nickel responsive regulator NikR [Myxococcales bacterium]
MKDPLVRFGVAIEASLLKEIDVLTKERDCTRSELFRDLSRGEVGRAKVKKGVEAVGTLTIVYDHHMRDLSNKLTELQHQLGDGVRSALHVHLSHDLCLEVIVLHGRADRLQELADRIRAMRGVKQGGLEIFAGLATASAHEHGHAPAPRAKRSSAHSHPHGPIRAPRR